MSPLCRAIPMTATRWQPFAGLAMRAHSFGKKVVDSASGVLRVIENSQVLVHTVPALMARATLCARSTSFVKIEAARPKMVAFARVIASSSVAKVSKPSTGPNISANHSLGPANPLPCYTARGRLRRSGLPRSRLRGSGHRRRSSSRTLRSSSSTSALMLTRQWAKVSPVAPAARSSFHRARIAAISSKSDRSIFVFVIT